MKRNCCVKQCRLIANETGKCWMHERDADEMFATIHPSQSALDALLAMQAVLEREVVELSDQIVMRREQLGAIESTERLLKKMGDGSERVQAAPTDGER
jgi:hypothetical protein